MQVRVHGRNVNLDERLLSAAESKVAKAARFFDGAGDADVEVTEARNPRVAAERFRVEITAPTAGSTVRVESTADTAEGALDLAVEKLERQLRKVKGRLIDRSRKGNRRENRAPAPADESVEQGEPRIVRLKQFVMKPMTPEEAALQMEMLGHAFFFFQNADSDLPSVLYRRRDGAYGLIEPA